MVLDTTTKTENTLRLEKISLPSLVGTGKESRQDDYHPSPPAGVWLNLCQEMRHRLKGASLYTERHVQYKAGILAIHHVHVSNLAPSFILMQATGRCREM
jgi:hypothetical protein